MYITEYNQVYADMKPSILWHVIVLTGQTSQYGFIKEPTTGIVNYTTPHAIRLGYPVIREIKGSKTNSTINNRTVPIVKNTRSENYRYYIDFNMGHPLQHIEAELNLKHRGLYIVSGARPTHSVSDFVYSLWRMKPRDGIFALGRSKTYKRISRYFSTSSEIYGIKWAAFASDDLYIGVSVLESAKFILLDESPEPATIGLGISPSNSKYISEDPSEEESTNIFNQMKEKGWTHKAAFSIWIGSETSETSGMILFNSVNYQYAQSHMYLFPLLKINKQDGYFIKLDGINTVNLDGSTTEVVKLSMPIELDFQMPYTTFPTEIVRLFYESYEVAPQKEFKVLCQTEFRKGAIALIFSGVQFTFPYQDILPDCQKGNTHCSPPFYPGRKAVLGANFLSALYLVFDIDKREIGLAMANTNIAAMSVGIEPIGNSISGTSAPFYFSTTFKITSTIVSSDRSINFAENKEVVTMLMLPMPNEPSNYSGSRIQQNQQRACSFGITNLSQKNECDVNS